MLLEGIIWAGFGLIFGSFTNVLISRQGTGRTLGGRSQCPKCERILCWYELVPVLSFLALRGRCTTCHTRISLQYPIVEILIALVFVFLGFAPLPLFARIVGCAIAIFLVAIAVYDLYEMIMPDEWVWSFNLLAFIYFAYLFVYDFSNFAMLLSAGSVVAAPLFGMWYFSRGAWMGFGDVKFALGMGWLLGIVYGYVALMYAFIIGAIVGLALIFVPRVIMRVRGFTPTPMGALLLSVFRIGVRSPIGREDNSQPSSPYLQQKTMPPLVSGYTMKSEVPFGPFLIVATFVIWISQLYGIDLASPFISGFIW